MNSNYVAEIQSTCIPNEKLVAGQHIALPCVNAVLGIKYELTEFADECL